MASASRAADYIYGGLMSGGNKLVEGLERRKEEEKNEAKKFKSLVSFAEASGMLTKDQAEVMDVESLEGFVRGKIFNQESQRSNRHAALEQFATMRKMQQDADLTSFVGEFNDSMVRSPNLGDYYENPGNYAQRPTGDPLAAFQQASTMYPGALTHPQFSGLSTTFDRFAPKEFTPPDIVKKLSALKAARTAGNTEDEKIIHADIQKDITPSGMRLEIGKDGNIVFSQGQGNATTAFTTEAQKAEANAAATFATIDHIMANQQDSDWGIRGLIGKVKDEWVAQAIPAAADPRRIDVQAAVSQLRQQMMAVLKAESQISQKDKEEIMQSLPKTGAGESPQSAMQKIARAKAMMQDRIRAYSAQLGKSPPLYAMTPEQIANAMKAGVLTQQQAIEALWKYHPDLLK